MGKMVDLTGQVFNRLKVLRISEQRDNRDKTYKWECICDCGNITFADCSHLKSGSIQSCGCLAAQCRIVRMGKLQVQGTVPARLNDNLMITNTSGTRGISPRKKGWIASMNFQKKRYYLGYFTNKQDAINARKKAEDELWKPFLELLEVKERVIE